MRVGRGDGTGQIGLIVVLDYTGRRMALMSIFTNLLHLFKGGARRQAASEKAARGGDPGIGREEAAAWLAAFESGDFRIPENVHDPAGWDRYWSAQLQHGGLEQGFNDMMANNPELIALLRKRRARAILCAGNGISSEAYALALHGFDVTVLDVSTVPNALFAAIVADSDHAFHSIPGFTVRGDAHVTFEGDRLIDPA